jgi:hypothetical protein
MRFFDSFYIETEPIFSYFVWWRTEQCVEIMQSVEIGNKQFTNQLWSELSKQYVTQFYEVKYCAMTPSMVISIQCFMLISSKSCRGLNILGKYVKQKKEKVNQFLIEASFFL